MNSALPIIAMAMDQRPETKKDDLNRQKRSGLSAMTAPWLMIAAVVLGILGGLAIDRAWDSQPWGLLVCALMGIGSGIYLVVREGSR